jgi:tetratricopeptide (TPR) repeat protein
VDAELDAIALAGWSDLASDAADDALQAFRAVVENRPEDIAAWEGVRAAAEQLGDHVQMALASAQLGALCKDDARAAQFWEIAGVVLLEHTDAHDDAEIAFERAFERNPRLDLAFDKLFRAVRARNEDERLLDIIARRLQVAENDAEIAKLFWERARVLRKKGDTQGALTALDNVTMLEPDHVGALALSGEIYISKGRFEDAANMFARLSQSSEAPRQQRLMSGIASVDLYENKLKQFDKALEVLVGLHRANLSTPPVRERLARIATRIGAWRDAANILEQLMVERDKPEGRVEAARGAMQVWRDHLREPTRGLSAVAKLLDEVPDDGEAVDLVLTTGYEQGFRTRVLGRAKVTLLQALQRDPVDADRVALLAKIAGAGGDAPLRQATLGALVALGRNDPGLSDELARIDMRVATRPQIALDVHAMAEIADPLDTGPIPELFAYMAETISAALGPSLESLGVTRRDRVDARGGPPLRLAVAEWMGALGFEGDFELYTGGPEPRGVFGVAGEQPAIVVGREIAVPLSAAARSAIAREVFALRRGISAVRTRDESTLASVVFAACIEAGFPVPHPQYAVFGEVSRAIHKTISRKVKRLLLDPCQRIAAGGYEARDWIDAARRSIDRMAVIAAGDVSLVLADLLGTPREHVSALARDSDRARRLLAFVLSPNYLEIRRKLGMGVR